MRRYVIFGVLVYAYFLLSGLPAEVALRWAAPDTVTFHDVQGTLWDGSAKAVSAGTVVLGDTSWNVSTLRLLTGRVSADVKSRMGESRFNARVSKPFFGNRLHLKDLRGIVMLDSLPRDMLKTEITGRVGLNFERLSLANMWPVDAVGSVDFVDTVVNEMGEQIEIGSFAATFDGATTDDGALLAVLGDTDSALEIGGTFKLTPDYAYLLDATVKAKPEAPRFIADNLSFIGPSVGEDRYRLQRRDQVRPAPAPTPSGD